MRQTLVSQDFLLIPSKDVRIGRLVLNARQPHLDFLDPPDIDKVLVTDAPQKNFNEIIFQESATNIKAVVSKIASGRFGKADNDNFRVSTLKAHAYRMQNSGPWFDNLIDADGPVRRYLEEEMIQRGKNVYLVVGYATITDAKVSEQRKRALEIGGAFQVPVTEISGGKGDALDAKVDVEHMHKQGLRRSYVPEGEQIYGIEYRKVKIDWLNRKDVSKSSVEKGTRWKYVWSDRHAGGGDASDGDPVDAVLTDNDEIGDVSYRTEDGDECFYSIGEDDVDDDDDEGL